MFSLHLLCTSLCAASAPPRGRWRSRFYKEEVYWCQAVGHWETLLRRSVVFVVAIAVADIRDIDDVAMVIIPQFFRSLFRRQAVIQAFCRGRLSIGSGAYSPLGSGDLLYISLSIYIYISTPGLLPPSLEPHNLPS